MKFIRALALIMAFTLCACLFAGCGQTNADHSGYPSAKTKADDDWANPTDESVVLEKGDVRLTFDTATTHFTVTDLRKNVTYSSVPSGEGAGFSEEAANRMGSELTVTYYEERSNAMFMYSDANSVAFGNFEVKHKGDAIRVYYDLSLSAEKIFVPQVLDAKTYEEDVLGAIEDPNVARRLSRYYTLYDKKDPADDFGEQKKLYPQLEKTPLYILSSSVNDVEKEEISDYIKEAGYSEGEYAELLEKLKIEGIEAEAEAGFTVPVEYSVTDDGFTAKILSDKIVENSGEFKLQTVTLLEYFGSTDATEKGYYVVPDGSGAIIDLGTKGTSDFSQSFYGVDESINTAEKTQLTKNLTLPIFGISHENGGILAIVENAAEVGTLNVGTVHNFSPRNHIYVDFRYRHMDATDVGELMQIPIYNLFSKHILRIAPTVRYVLLGADEANYTAMADYYRNYLINNESIKENKTEGSPVYLNFLCSIRKDATFVGIPYEKKIVLSTLKDIIKTVKDLREEGIENINVRLLGYTENGLAHGVYNRWGLDKKVGSEAELKELKKLVESDGGELYLDADFQYVYIDSKSKDFDAADDTAHYLNRALVKNVVHDTVTRQVDNGILKKYLISPTRYVDYAKDYIASAKKELSFVPSLSYASAGQYLGGDYTAKKDLDRAMSLYLLGNALKGADKNAKLMFENGNAYVLPFASAILNVPLFSSRFDLESGDIPLYQMVAHGLVPYAGTAQNLAVNPAENYLRSVEYGAALSYTLITGENDLLVNTDYESRFYSVSIDSVKEKILTQYSEAGEYLNSVANAKITGNFAVAADVYKTAYDNGRSVLVNYGSKDAEVDGVKIPAGSFTVN